MTISQWVVFFLVANAVHFVLFWKFYKKAGYPGWYAAIPFYNTWILTKIINRPWYWFPLLYVPVINLLMMAVYLVQLAEVFGMKDAKSKWLSVLTGGLYLAYVAYTKYDSLHYNPQHDDKETVLGAIVFAVVAATLVHNYMFQPYMIPTGSLEKSLLVGDYLFVSKMHYGPRIPMTTVSVPMLHDTIPVLNIRSYLKRPQLPYMRLPGFTKIKRNDIVVFNWPRDTVRHFFEPTHERIRKPIDKKSNYVKRCVGLPGDTIQLIKGRLYVNGKPARYPDRTYIEHMYIVKTDSGKSLSFSELRFLKKKYDLNRDDWGMVGKGVYMMNLTKQALDAVKHFPEVDTVYMALDTVKSKRIFPGDGRWSYDNFGPLYIPKKGDKIRLTKENYPLYKHLLQEYETMASLKENKVSFHDGSVYINGKPVKEYTFKQDYYWMMGDNRSRSEDSRIWGFVPWTHVVGKPVFIWFSRDKETGKIRWDRVFTTVSGKGKRVSYLWVFVILLVVYFGFDYYRKKKRKNK